MRGSVALWCIGRPPEIVSGGGGAWAVWFPPRTTAFVVGPAPHPNGPLSRQEIAQQVQAATQRACPDAIIGSHRVIAVGSAWERPDLVRALRAMLAHGAMEQLTVIDGRTPWYVRLWRWLGAVALPPDDVELRA